MHRYLLLLLALLVGSCKNTDSSSVVAASMTENLEESPMGPVVGAENLQLYVPKLKNKNVALVANQSSLVGATHLLDTLLMLDVDVQKIFTPEHGFRGSADAGEKVDDSKDAKSGLPIVSLYGKNRKPADADLQDVDVIVFDLQDVGVRCYTYISTLHYLMEACVENSVELIVLDRPNPNGHYIDGPMLKKEYQSFVGMHPVPLVHGMTIGEYAQMIKGQHWFEQSDLLKLTVVPCSNYQRTDRYPLPVAPSPNLPNYRSVLLYPSLVFFEGTEVSVGRGTDTPFQLYGHPKWSLSSFVFTPKSTMGAKHPKHKDLACYGSNLVSMDPHQIRELQEIQLSWLMTAYETTKQTAKDASFFLENKFIDKLAGTSQLRKDILAGKSEEDIRKSWQPGLEAFAQMRKPYLLYDDI